MERLKRFWRHLGSASRQGPTCFSPATLQAIQAAIAHGETLHRAEVRLIVEPSLSLAHLWDQASPRERAQELFAEHGIWDTEENCGILIYICLADHRVEIVSDRTASGLLTQEEWQEICGAMTAGFARKDFHDSTLAALKKLNSLLQERFPDQGGTNQLSNRPIML